MRKLFQVFLAIFGVVAIFISCLHIVLGPSSIPGAVPVNATMDSEDRFYATLFMAFGAALLWCVKDVERKDAQVKLLALVFFVGGLARLVSMLAVGLPGPFFIAMTILELTLPVGMAWMSGRISAASRA